MRIDGQIQGAQFEQIASTNPTPAVLGRFYIDTTLTNKVPKLHDGTRYHYVKLGRKNSESTANNGTVSADSEEAFLDCTSGAISIILPACAGSTGHCLRLYKVDNTLNKATVAANSGDTVEGGASIKLCTYKEWVDLYSNGTSWTILAHGYYEGKVAWTPTSTWVSNATHTGWYWRQGNKLCFEAQIALTGAPTAASLVITLPTNTSMDTSKMMSALTANHMAINSTVNVYDDSATDSFPGFAFYASSTTIAIKKDDGDGTCSVTNATAPMTFANLDRVWVIVNDLPMTDWLG